MLGTLFIMMIGTAKADWTCIGALRRIAVCFASYRSLIGSSLMLDTCQSFDWTALQSNVEPIRWSAMRPMLLCESRGSQ